ncbi:hypothetical protein LTR94_031312, partial [Friedmanniomyces endolithicus]
RIMAAAAQLNYTPDMLARRMRGDKSKLIGVFMNNYGPVVLHELVRAIGEQARKRDYDLLPARIEAIDRDVAAREERLADPALYTRDPAAFDRLTKEIAALRDEKDTAEMRWLELAERVEGAG